MLKLKASSPKERGMFPLVEFSLTLDRDYGEWHLRAFLLGFGFHLYSEKSLEDRAKVLLKQADKMKAKPR